MQCLFWSLSKPPGIDNRKQKGEQREYELWKDFKFTFGFTVLKGNSTFMLGDEPAAAQKAEGPSWFRLVCTKRTNSAGFKAIGRIVPRRTLP